MLVYEVVVAV